MAPPTNTFREYPATVWCFRFWHKIRYGSKEKITKVNNQITVVEYFCNKCGQKTDGYTHFKLN